MICFLRSNKSVIFHLTVDELSLYETELVLLRFNIEGGFGGEH